MTIRSVRWKEEISCWVFERETIERKEEEEDDDDDRDDGDKTGESGEIIEA